MFRSRFSRPKPNLSAAKKAQVVKKSVSGSEDEKVSNSVKNESTTPKPPPPPPQADTAATADPPCPPSPRKLLQETASLPALVVEDENRSLVPLSTEEGGSKPPTTEPAAAAVLEPGPVRRSRPTEPRPRLSPAFDLSPSKSDVERDESPLFIPKPSEQPPPAKAATPASAKPTPGPRRRAAPVHRTDLDEVYADSENSDGDASVLSDEGRNRKLEDILMRKGVRKKPSEPRYRPVVKRIGDTNSAPMDRSTVTMRDLIYYTNRNNPPPSYRQEREMKQYGKLGCAWFTEENAEKMSVDAEKPQKAITAESTSSLAEEPAAMETKDKGKEKKKSETGGQAQFVLDADGNIVLNEESLIIRREYNDDDYIDIKQDGVIGTATYSSFRKQKPRSKKWSLRETIRLYKALSTVGTDFSFMSRLFKYRTREEIKRKFKREEKARPTIIDRVLSNRKHFDLSILDDTSDSEKSNSSSDSNDDESAIRAVIDSDNPVPELCGPNAPRFRRSRGRGYRRQKRYKCIDVETGEPIPGNPKWHVSKTAYRQDEGGPPSKRIKVDHSAINGAMTEALQNYERKHLQPSTSTAGPPSNQPLPCPSPAPSSNSRPASRAGSVGMEYVLTRLLDQKMRDIQERSVISPAPLRRSRELSPPPLRPTVRNQSLSLDDFCKHEANLQS